LVCGCDEAGCSFNREPSDTFSFQFGMNGRFILSGPDSRCGDCTVRLERVE